MGTAKHQGGVSVSRGGPIKGDRREVTLLGVLRTRLPRVMAAEVGDSPSART